GDLLAQKRSDGGIGLGATATSAIFLITILGLVTYLSVTKKDQPPAQSAVDQHQEHEVATLNS
ncbi:MAG: hypothetical protein ACRDRL_07985, partial [Sciscionella sp.]